MAEVPALHIATLPDLEAGRRLYDPAGVVRAADCGAGDGGRAQHLNATGRGHLSEPPKGLRSV